MCGICGEVRFDGALADTGAVTTMTRALALRGPDGEGLFTRGPVALGHRRLSIIDLSGRGSRPMVDPELGIALVFNGCIYNFNALRDDLRAPGYRFFSDADSEVVIKAYHRWGTGCFARFRGMFAVGIVELDAGVTLLARDRLGVGPLYLTHEHDRVRFASSVQALLAGGGKGVLKDAARGLVPDEVIDRSKGYFPVPGIRHLEGAVLDLVRDGSRAARERGVFRPEAVSALLADPNATRTTLDGNTLWQVALLELWLQSLPGCTGPSAAVGMPHPGLHSRGSERNAG